MHFCVWNCSFDLLFGIRARGGGTTYPVYGLERIIACAAGARGDPWTQ